MAGRSGKARAFAFIIYPESWPTWADDLDDLHMPVLVSPLHDRDVVKETGELKKPHYHGLISWSGPVTLKNALMTLEPFGIKHVEPVGSYQGYCRYLVHMDNPEKAQYDVADVRSFGGAVPDFDRKLTNSEVIAQQAEIMAFIIAEGILEYADLCDYCMRHRPDWSREVNGKTLFWTAYLRSKRAIALGRAAASAPAVPPPGRTEQSS